MTFSLGIKSDPVEYRYSYEWLFSLMRELRVEYLQLGSSFEFYLADDSFFVDLRALAERYGVWITSCFTAHRELGGFFTDDPRLVAVARRAYERWIAVAGLLGADFVGSNPGAVYRDRLDAKPRGSAVYLEHLTELMHAGFAAGVKGLTIEPMSSSAEPPSLPDEIATYGEVALAYWREHPRDTVPAYFCGDISHGVVGADRTVLHDHWELFELEIPRMAEFHFKNTDALYHSTFGFGDADLQRGIVHLGELRDILDRRADDFPVDRLVGYLEIGGPKLGRDYSDPLLRDQLVESVEAIRAVFPET
ncbi:MAG: sugar phosphate isomerase/epimerase family protein [Spirochaetota bacterium]